MSGRFLRSAGLSEIRDDAPVVIHNLISSRAVPELLAAAGATPVRSRVGHSFIKAEMARLNAVFGGEHSAHFYFRDFFYADSGMLAAMHVLAALGGQAQPLSELLAAYSPCLILIDEWVAYARQLSDSREDLIGGGFDTQFTFAQALTEAARAVPGSLLVVSLPASEGTGDSGIGSDIETGGADGREALRKLRNVIGRMESSWRPATAEESFEIVRRRLFRRRARHRAPRARRLHQARDDQAGRLPPTRTAFRFPFPHAVESTGTGSGKYSTRRPEKSAVGTEEWPCRGRTKE